MAFINPHGSLDNPTFRGIRWHLLKTYDKIYTIDLHGNAKKKETAERVPNLNKEIVKRITEKLDLTFTNEKEHRTTNKDIEM